MASNTDPTRAVATDPAERPPELAAQGVLDVAMAYFFTRPPVRWYGNGRRLFYGSLWSLYAAVSILAFFVSLGKASALSQLLVGVVIFLAGSYAYRIWTWRARRLWLLVIF